MTQRTARRLGAMLASAALFATFACTGALTAPDSPFESSAPAVRVLNPALLDTLIEQIGHGEYGVDHSLLILRHGRLDQAITFVPRYIVSAVQAPDGG